MLKHCVALVVVLMFLVPAATQEPQTAPKKDQAVIPTVPAEAAKKANPVKPTAESMIAGYRQLIDRAHSYGIKVMGATITPAETAHHSAIPGHLGLIAMVTGLIIGRLNMEHQVEDWVYEIRMGEAGELPDQTWPEKLAYARGYVGEIVGKVWPYVVAGIGIGAVMHGYIPNDFLVKYAGPDNPFAVPIAVLIGVPLYSNAAGVIPLVSVLTEKGMAMGTVLAFMMAVVGLSLPEAIILRKVLKPKLIAVYFGVNAVGIMAIGYLFNLVLR